MSTYSFTALLEADLLQGVNGSSIGYGDTFVMPEGATVEFVVTDDDNTLSGDYYNNEHGDDTSGQTADITINGEQVFDDVKIYAESYHVLVGSDGNYYYLMEIETAGSEDAPGEGDDFFTFWGWTPPAGIELTVCGTYNVTCDWMDYNCLTGGDLIVIEPENTAPEAVDDALMTDEKTTITANLLDNDSDADGDPITITAIQDGNIGEAFEVTTAKGFTGQVSVESDGTFTFDPDSNFKALAEGEQDSFQLTYTITDDPTAAVKHNLMFVLDVSNSTIGAGGGNNVFDGAGVGDVNGDGLSNTVLDAEIAAVLAAVQSLIDEGVDPSNIDVGIATFSGVASGFASVDAETLGTFALNDGGLSTALQSIQSGGWTNYEAGLQEAENWFAGQAGDGAQNKLIFLSDGRPISGYDYSARQYVTQTNADYGDEVSRIANDYGADIYGIGVGANADLDYLNDLDNTGGAERVTDAATLNVVVENAVAQPASSTATVTVTINGLNDAPEALDDLLTVNEDETGSINILANDSDPDGDMITIVEVSGRKAGESFEVTTTGGRNGTVTVQNDGTFVFDPGEEFKGLAQDATDSVRLAYTITDGQLGENLIVNGGFENHGTLTRGDVSGGNSWDTFDTIEGWYTPIGVLEIQQGTHGGTPINSTTNSVLEVDSHDSVDTNASVVQDINVSQAGFYTFEFDYSPRQLGAEIGSTSVLNVWVNGEIVATLSSETLGYESQSVNVELLVGANTVGFSGGGTDDTYGALVDNVSLREVITDTAEVEVIVNGLNEGPTAKSDGLEVTESQGGTINILSNDSDPEGDDLQILQVNDTAPGDPIFVTSAGGRTGIVTYQADGTLTFTPDQSFENLNEGESDLVELSYSISDGQFTDDATVSVLINGTGSANGRVTLQGAIAASVSGQTHVVVVLDSSVFTTGFAAGMTLTDLDNDGNNGAIMDLMLTKVLDLADALADTDQITLIPSGYDGGTFQTDSFTYSAGEIKGAANGTSGQTPQDLFNPLVSNYFGTDYAIDLPQGLMKAEEVLTAIGADQNQVIVMTATDTVDQPASVMARQSLVANANAEIDILYIEAGANAPLSNLSAIDTDGGVDVDANFNFGLVDLIDPAPSVLADVESFSVLVDGQKVLGIDESALTVNAAGDGFEFSGEVDLNGQTGEVDVIVAIDTDLDPTTEAEIFTLSDTISSLDRTVVDQDTFLFDFA